jgi:uncharacterized protein (TIGR00369 family)
MNNNVNRPNTAGPDEKGAQAGSPETVARLLDAHFPEVRDHIGDITIVRADGGHAEVRLAFDQRFKRPGGTISGPTMFTLADLTSYVAILGVLGEAGIDAVTTTLTINFLARPEPADLICRVDLLRQGRRQIVCEARIFGTDDDKLVAQASCIYALPTPRS